MTKSNSQNLTSGKLLARNTIYSLIGQGAPLLVAVFTIPGLIKGLGTDRFGILTLAWMVISYFSLFDLGLGRALTQLVAQKLGEGSEEESISTLIWTASVLMLGLGVVGTVVLGLLSPWLVYDVLKIPQELQSETLHAFYLLSASVPIVTTSAGFVGVLSALQRFDLINATRIPQGLFTFAGPLLVLPFSSSLVAVTAVLVTGRFIFWVIYLGLCFRVMPILRQKIQFQRKLLPSLLKFGIWMTSSNIISPLMVYMDRFIIAGLISVTAVAYYTTPFEVVTKLLIIPGALIRVLFPAFSNSFVKNPNRAKKLFNKSIKYILFAMTPIILIIIYFAHDGLNLWLGIEFAANSTQVLQILSVGVLFNSIAQVPFSFIQGIGKPQITAKLHLIELPFYLFCLWYLCNTFGIVGAAYAWVLRVAVDALMLLYFAHLCQK